ncbi:hypothetical protein MtrunA17_Chr3g0120811 [Medicago truncatula]|uniref:Uncharacterized protein n=1 Tax=Medicago truncatula TaxID=3880 RepID=A0A396IXH7_MEDTR|nr:hypothetical protein MtrunA17_Chr3g0120811 [Medicago truncatula]
MLLLGDLKTEEFNMTFIGFAKSKQIKPTSHSNDNIFMHSLPMLHSFCYSSFPQHSVAAQHSLVAALPFSVLESLHALLVVSSLVLS